MAANGSTSTVTHTVKKTDTVQGLSLMYGCTVDAIMRTNKLWSRDSIYGRKTLLIPVVTPLIDPFASPHDPPVTLKGKEVIRRASPSPPAASPTGFTSMTLDPWMEHKDDDWLLGSPPTPKTDDHLAPPHGRGTLPGWIVTQPSDTSSTTTRESVGSVLARQATEAPPPKGTSDFFARIDSDVGDILGRLTDQYGSDMVREIEDAEDSHRPSLKRLQRYAVDLPWSDQGKPKKSASVGPRMRNAASSESLGSSLGRRLRRPPSELLDGHRPGELFGYFAEDPPRRSMSPGTGGRRTPTVTTSPLKGRVGPDDVGNLSSSVSSLSGLGKLALNAATAVSRMSLDRISLDGSPKLSQHPSFESSELRSFGLRSQYGPHVDPFAKGSVGEIPALQPSALNRRAA